MSVELTLGGPVEEEPDERIDLLGKPFKISDKVGLMPLLRFAHLSSRGVNTDDMEGLAAMYDMLRTVVADEEWGSFMDHATTVRADQDDLLGAVRTAIEAMTARPTVRPSDSSDGPLNAETSTSDSSSVTGSSTPVSDTPSPLLRDPRVLSLVPLDQVAV